MSKPNWKRRGFKSHQDLKDKDVRDTVQYLRERKLRMLPPELRAEITKQPQLLDLV
jgi:hypothetical protein